MLLKLSSAVLFCVKYWGCAGASPSVSPSHIMCSKIIQNATLMFSPRVLLYIWALEGFKYLTATITVERGNCQSTRCLFKQKVGLKQVPV